MRHDIATGALAPGSRMPSERALAEAYGVSRQTVREAVIALEIAGLIEIRGGSGMYVRRGGSFASLHLASPHLGDAGAGPLELIDARVLIEAEVAAQAARRIDNRQLGRLEVTLLEMSAVPASGGHRDSDGRFHTRVAEATGNEVLVTVVNGLWSETFSPLFQRLGLLTGLFGGETDVALAHHRAIFEAISRRDPDAAREAMRAHLLDVRAVLLGAHRGDGTIIARAGDPDP